MPYDYYKEIPGNYRNQIYNLDFEAIEEYEKRHTPLYMSDYVENLDRILTSTGATLLTDAGTISHEQAMEKAKTEYKNYQVQNLSPVEEAYLQTINALEKTAKKMK